HARRDPRERGRSHLVAVVLALRVVDADEDHHAWPLRRDRAHERREVLVLRVAALLARLLCGRRLARYAIALDLRVATGALLAVHDVLEHLHHRARRRHSHQPLGLTLVARDLVAV